MVITDPYEQQDIMQNMHVGPKARRGCGDTLEAGAISGHVGVNRTRDKIAMSFFWEGMAKDVEKFVRSCDRCQRSKQMQMQKTKQVLHPIYVESKVSISS